MKKHIKWALGLGCLLALAGCARTLVIGPQEGVAVLLRVTKDQTTVEIESPDSIEQITDGLNRPTYEQLELDSVGAGEGYILEWYDGQGRLAAQAQVLDEQTVCCQEGLYHVREGQQGLDLGLLEQMLEQEREQQDGPPVRVEYADGEPAHREGDWYACTVDDSDQAVEVVFHAKQELRNVKVVQLEWKEDERTGEMVFEASKEYGSFDRLTQDTPLFVRMAFVGVIPHVGISFETTDAGVRHYAVAMSGKDASLLLIEI